MIEVSTYGIIVQDFLLVSRIRREYNNLEE